MSSVLTPRVGIPFSQARASVFSFILVLFSACIASGAEVYEPKPGSAERAAIMDAMRGPVSSHVGKRVTFTGSVRVAGTWATFEGNVAPTDGKPVKGDVAFELELDFFALLRKTGAEWTPLHWGFAGDIGVAEEARKKFPGAPRALFPYLQ